MYMREYWIQVHSSPIVYRYVDWSITVPLQMIEFNLILKAAGKDTSALMFWKLLIVTLGWSIYPAGYYFGYLLGAVSDDALNVTYNIADFVNKIAFVLSCWACAKADSVGKVGALLG